MEGKTIAFGKENVLFQQNGLGLPPPSSISEQFFISKLEELVWRKKIRLKRWKHRSNKQLLWQLWHILLNLRIWKVPKNWIRLGGVFGVRRRIRKGIDSFSKNVNFIKSLFYWVSDIVIRNTFYSHLFYFWSFNYICFHNFEKK